MIEQVFLKEAEEKQKEFEAKINQLKTQLEHYSEMIGSCTGTHTFSKNFKNRQNINAYAIRIDDVFISKDINVYNDYRKKENLITLEELTPENINNINIRIQYTSITIYTVISGDKLSKRIESNVCFNTPDYLPITRVKISPEVFEGLLGAVAGAVENVLNKEERTNLAKEYFYESQYREDNSSRIDTLKKLGYKLVKIQDDMQLSRVLDWHPFVYRDHIVLSEESVQLVRDKYYEVCKNNSFSANLIASYGERFRPTSAESDYRELLEYLEKELQNEIKRSN